MSQTKNPLYNLNVDSTQSVSTLTDVEAAKIQVSGIDLHVIERELERKFATVPAWIMLILECIIVGSLMVLPSLVVYTFAPEKNSMGNSLKHYSLFADTFNLTLNMRMEFMRWSIFIAIIYVVYTVTMFFAERVGIYIVKLSKVMHHEINAEDQVRLSYVSASADELALMFTTFVGYILGEVMIYRVLEHYGSPNSYFYIVSTFLAVFVASLFFFVKEVFIKSLEGNFRSKRFGVRIRVNNYWMSVMHQLRKVAMVSNNGQKVYKSIGSKVSPQEESLGCGLGLLEVSVPETRKEAKELATGIFASISKKGLISNMEMKAFFVDADYNDVYNVFGINKKDEREESVDKETFVRKVADMYEDRRNLEESLNSHGMIIKRIEAVANFIVGILSLIAIFSVYDIDLKKIILTIGTAFVAFLVLFKSTVTELYKAFIFLFIIHPLDVGDRVRIEGKELIVLGIDFLSSRFRKVDGSIEYRDNSKLAGQSIDNITRSGNMSETIKVHAAPSTTAEQVIKAREGMEEYVKANPLDFSKVSYASVDVKDVDGVMKLEMVISLVHTGNFHDITKKNKRRFDFVLEIKRVMEAASIKFEVV